ncbi:MFS transporter [Candidatus Aerophobetes bacterium]|nr:MFS transporter [Candidatus Aerophobetes bacterium]
MISVKNRMDDMQKEKLRNCRFLTNINVIRTVGFSVIIMVFFFSYFHRVSTSVLVPDLVDSFAVSSTLIGLLASAYFYSYAAVQPLAGILVDRWKPRTVVFVSAILMGLGSTLFALATNFWVAFLARIIIGAGAGGVFIPIVWFISRWFSIKRRAFVFSFVMITGNSGAVLAAGPLGKLVSIAGWRGAILIFTAVTFVFAILTWMIVRNDPQEVTSREDVNKQNKHKSTQNVSPATSAQKSNVNKVQWLKLLRVTFEIRVIRLMLCVVFLSYGALMSFQGVWGVPFLMDVYSLSRTSASNIITILPIGIIIGSLVLGRMLDTKLGMLFYLMGFISAAVVYFIFTVATAILAPIAIFLCIFILGLTNIAFAFTLKVYSKTLPYEHLGSAMGIVNTVPFFGGMVFQPLTGFLFDLFGKDLSTPVVAYRYFFMLLSLSLMAAIIIAFKVKKELQGKI